MQWRVVMKTLHLAARFVFVSLFALTATACAAESTEEDVGESGDALIMRSPTGGTSYACTLRECYNKCASAYPNGGGPLVTCRNLCNISPTCGDVSVTTRY